MNIRKARFWDYILAGFDWVVTRGMFYPLIDMPGFGDTTLHSPRTVFHFRIGEEITVRFPNGIVQCISTRTIVHQYDGYRLVERKRIEDEPRGFVIYNTSIKEAVEAILSTLPSSKS